MKTYEELTQEIERLLAERKPVEQSIREFEREIADLNKRLKTIDNETMRLYQERAGQKPLF